MEGVLYRLLAEPELPDKEPGAPELYVQVPMSMLNVEVYDSRAGLGNNWDRAWCL